LEWMIDTSFKEGEQGLQMQKPFTQQLGYPWQTLLQSTMWGHSKGPLASTDAGFPIIHWMINELA